MNYELWFAILEITNSRKLKLLDEYKSPENVYLNFEEIINKNNILKKKFENFNKESIIRDISALERKICNEKISYITCCDSRYRERLSNISQMPYILFYKGNINTIFDKCVGIVGSRNCSKYGIAVTKLLTNELITNNITLISGGARGIDSIAHKQALKCDGKNICILGCGIDIAYPRENLKMFDKISETGLLVSEFLPGTMPNKYNFPRRNRIISGLSKCLIVAEAAKKSGALITARYAMEKGKAVFIVPGSYLYSGALGSNKLIQDGAQVLTEFQDIKDELSLDSVSIKETFNNISVDKINILNVINNSPIHVDEIVRKVKMDAGVLYALLFEMQMKNEIICLPGNYYVRVI
ncbi:DNA-processing protein DprA [Clostridium sp. BJN0001]|uniref:DNA-processing protein DprA n=1 Tax=Clostridium sp. BJN0001 TaxID=2930219 RepID=UPI001FD1AF00|nr:DNA-processing protein DprA [Clostridium sp. BJN0001]